LNSLAMFTLSDVSPALKSHGFYQDRRSLLALCDLKYRIFISQATFIARLNNPKTECGMLRSDLE
jgi:hypothetical protein